MGTQKILLFQSFLLLSLNRDAMFELGYLIPPQDLLKGMEREQLAVGIRKKSSVRHRGHTSLLSARISKLVGKTNKI